MYIASMLRVDHDVLIYDAELFGDSPLSLAITLQGYEPDIIGFTSTILTHATMQECIAEVRSVTPEVKIMVGGPQITSLPKDELDDIDFDLCVLGECEGNIADLIMKTGIHQGERIHDLDDIPLPSRDLLIGHLTEYRGNSPRHKLPETSVLWSRGCPHRCIFCANSVFGKSPIRYRSPESIVEELKLLYHIYGIKGVFVYDDELLGQSKYQTEWLRSVLELIIEEGLHKKIAFKCQARCNPRVFGLEDIQLMKKAGFKTIMWGIESGSTNVLKSIKKDITPDYVRTVFEWCKTAKMKTYAFMMIGSWNETLADIELSRQLMREIKPDWIQWTVCTPMYPTKFRELVADQIVKEQDERPIYFYDAITSTNILSRDEIFTVYMDIKRENILRNYLTWKRWFRLIYESIFTSRGRRVLRYRISKYRRLKGEGKL
jgi:radical SAM superfamily enzyme YgiQ (UPF0313 family)